LREGFEILGTESYPAAGCLSPWQAFGTATTNLTGVALMLFNQQLVTIWVAMVAVQLAQAQDQGMPS